MPATWVAITTAAPSAAIWTDGPAARDEGEREAEADRDEPGDGLQRLERRRQAPDAERRAAGRLVAEGAVVELARAAVGEEGEEEDGA